MTALASATVAMVCYAARCTTGIPPLEPGMAVVGPAATCRCAPGDNLAHHRLLPAAPAGSVLVCATGGDAAHGYFGEPMALDACNRGVAGLVLDGPVRGSSALAALGFPVFHRGLAPVPCAKASAPFVGEPVELAGVVVSPGDAVVADRDAVLFVPRDELPGVETRVDAHEAHEDDLRAALARGKRLADRLHFDLELGVEP